MFNPQPSNYRTYFVDLPLSRLHVLEAGEGEPLIIVPATISELENWYELIQFMAQWFHVYFFELPGHGQSQPFCDGFSSQRVAKLVEQLADSLEYDRFNLMGFSFGGILAMQTFKLLSHRIDRLMLIAPCLGYRALPFSSFRISLLNKANRVLSYPRVQSLFRDLIHNEHTISIVVSILQKVGRLEQTIPLKKKLAHTPLSTIAVLNAQVNEILTTEFSTEQEKYDTACYFAMSIHDPLLRFDVTLDILENIFEQVNTVRLSYPFHQPPAPFTCEQLNHGFYETVEAFLQRKIPARETGGNRQLVIA